MVSNLNDAASASQLGYGDAEIPKRITISDHFSTVPAKSLVWHPKLGLAEEDYLSAYEAEAEPELALLRMNKSPAYQPLCVVLDDGRFGVIGEMPTALAAMKRALEEPRLKIRVVVAGNGNASAATALFDVKQPRRPWEQAQFVRQNIGDKSVRDYLKLHNLPERFETTISKSKKLLALDPEILAVIDPMTITSIAEAGRVVALWNNAQSHVAMAAALYVQKREANQRLSARIVFAALIKAASSVLEKERHSTQASIWTPFEGGFQATFGSNQTVTATMLERGWTVQCIITDSADLRALSTLLLPSADELVFSNGSAIQAALSFDEASIVAKDGVD